jgi:hypothetical protein
MKDKTKMILQIKLFQLPVLTNFNSDLGVFFQESYETVFGVHLITNFSLQNNMKIMVRKTFCVKMCHKNCSKKFLNFYIVTLMTSE